MPTCIFILSRFTLRVDNVLFRAHDTRIYHSFASAPPLVVRETRGWEAPYERVKRVCNTFPSIYAHPSFLSDASSSFPGFHPHFPTRLCLEEMT
jgi:TIP41-like family